LFKKSAPSTDAEKLANFKETRTIINKGTGLSLAHHRSAKRAPPKPAAKPAPKPAAAPKAAKAKKEEADEGGSAAAFDDLKELNTFSAQED